MFWKNKINIFVRISAFLLIVLFRCRVWEQTHVTVSRCRSFQTLTRFNLAHHKCHTVSVLSEAGGGRVTFHGGRIPLFALTFVRLRPCVCICVSAWFCVEGMYRACGFFAAQKWNQRSPRDGTILSLFTRPWSLQIKTVMFLSMSVLYLCNSSHSCNSCRNYNHSLIPTFVTFTFITDLHKTKLLKDFQIPKSKFLTLAAIIASLRRRRRVMGAMPERHAP